MNLTRRQLLGSVAAAGAAACLPASAAEPVRSVSLYSFNVVKPVGADWWEWVIRYSVNGGEIQTKKCNTDDLAVELVDGAWLELGESPASCPVIGANYPPDEPMEWMFDSSSPYYVPRGTVL